MRGWHIQSVCESAGEGIVGSVASTDMLQCQGESLQDGCNTSNAVRCGYIGSEESTI